MDKLDLDDGPITPQSARLYQLRGAVPVGTRRPCGNGGWLCTHENPGDICIREECKDSCALEKRSRGAVTVQEADHAFHGWVICTFIGRRSGLTKLVVEDVHGRQSIHDPESVRPRSKENWT